MMMLCRYFFQLLMRRKQISPWIFFSCLLIDVTMKSCSALSSCRSGIWTPRSTQSVVRFSRVPIDIRTQFAGADDPETEEASLYQGVLDREAHVQLLDQSLRRWTGRGIMDRIPNSITSGDDDLDSILTSSRYALYSHGVLTPDMIDGAVTNFGNFAALSAFGLTWKQFVQIPCCRMAPPGFHQNNLGQTLEQLELAAQTQPEEKNQQVIERYSGLRSALGEEQQTTFRIRNAAIWNVVDNEGKYYGQATFFDREAIEVIS